MEVSVTQTLIISILVLYVGSFLIDHLRWLSKYNIPSAVVGGILCSLIVAIYYTATGREITFDLALRDLLLLVFFSTIGLSAKLRTLADGGIALGKMLLISILFLVLQNVAGIGVAALFGFNSGYGLMAGSISFAGGFGTAISWGEVAREAGLHGATEAGIACATFGLIAGGLIGGPLAEYLIQKNRLNGEIEPESPENETESGTSSIPVTIEGMLGTILALAICVSAGDVVNQWLHTKGLGLPGFLTALFVGIVLTNTLDLFQKELHSNAIRLCGDISLELFLSMSLMSMQLWTLASSVGPLLTVVVAQILVMALIAYHIVFRFMGRNYDAAVMSGGFIGLGLGATPVAMANMNALVKKYGASPQAFLVIPLMGAFFIDIANAMILRLFLSLHIY
ncbi:Sodium/glutamate symport carrier protein [Gimesia alba]|uniref:Sodium/glutamate symporter n=1 Tax=Gimesia alba TaxID=2527973 RepID=A0A517RHH0_9PLAN|nr:sodium/glutamate symporter [Gimesia alba]QDT43326.1 Sodium/glutamate symport carrier protein [Gimesia alba]